MTRQRIFTRAAVSHATALSIVSRQTRDLMDIDSIRELDPQERRVFDNYVRAVERGRVSQKWNGPLALWLAMVGRRPMFVEHDVGTGDYRRRERVMDWRIYEQQH